MRYLLHIALLALFLILSAVVLPASERVVSENRPATYWQKVLDQAAEVESFGERISLISKAFLDTPYRGGTLVGSREIPEVLIADFSAVDCFTLLDYVEAMRCSAGIDQLKVQLKKVRYQGGEVSFTKRNHFFTDWRVFRGRTVKDVTSEVGRDKTKAVVKTLNQKADGSLFLPGIAPKTRTVYYISAEALDSGILNRLHSGDYVGIYSPVAGLDVTHTGIIIRKEEGIYLRHASSQKRYRRVVDSDLLSYMEGKPGLVVLRPENSCFW